jgi:hypothetical protein
MKTIFKTLYSSEKFSRRYILIRKVLLMLRAQIVLLLVAFKKT